MKKKLFVSMAIASAFSLGCFSLAACNVINGGNDHTHTADSVWHNDETNHWHECTDTSCAEQFNKAPHDYDNEQDTTCNVCGYVREVTADPEPVNPTVTGVTARASATIGTAGDSVELSATVSGTGDYNNTVTWAITEGSSLATLSGNILTLTGIGVVKVQATSVGDISVKSDEIIITSILVTISGDNTVTAGNTLALTATVLPSSVTDSVSWRITGGSELATIDEATGVLTAGNTPGSVTVTATVSSVTSLPFGVTINADVSGDLILTYSYGGNECAAFEWSEATPANASVKYKLTTETNYTALDSQLIRSASTSGYARADIVGLKGGATYDFVITSSSGKTASVTKSVTAYDRSGYAHFNYTDGVGAYNDDGTPKANAQIIYVSEATKNTVTATLGTRTCTGIVSIMSYLFRSSNPVIIRVLDTIGAATWNKIDYNADKKYNSQNLMPESVVIGINGKQLPTASNTYQADLISGGYNTLNTSVWSELNGLDSRAKYANGEYDTIWNNCPIKNASNVTLEGIGESAGLFQWGLTWQSCNSIEVRNLTFEDYTEDACSFEGSKGSTTVDGFDSQRIWLHHNTFEEGINYWDLCAEQDKHEGDGATDFKQLSYLTTSYNVHHNNHKTGLVGGSDSTLTACVTFHHNYYNNNSSRLPLGRQANMHMYNNYYYKSTGTNMSIRAGAYAFIENCYFDNCSTPIEIKTGDSKTGAVKLYQNVFSGKNYSSNSYIYEVTDRTKVVANDNIYNQKFDTDSSAFYYDATNKTTDVSVLYTAEETKVNVPLLAGVQKRNGTTAIDPEGGNQGGSGSGSESGGSSGSETLTSTSITADNCGVSAGNNFTSKTNDLFTLENSSSSATYTVTALLAAGGSTSATANDSSGLTFSNAFLPNSASNVSMTVTAKKAITVTVYYTVSDSKFNSQSQSKSGYLQWTINGGTQKSDSNTSSKDGRTAYAVNISLSSGDVLVLTSSGNRLVIFGVVAN
ncbi:MAG: Ig-like domain-containing protein [Candidatus Coproplasma sp.]